MEREIIQQEISSVIAEYGDYPYKFFTILLKSDNPNVDFDTQNRAWEFIKNEKWHSLDLSNYILWSISDNGDLLWWNGEQTIIMNPRASQYLSEPVAPKQFMRLVGLKKVGNILPIDLVNENA